MSVGAWKLLQSVKELNVSLSSILFTDERTAPIKLAQQMIGLPAGRVLIIANQKKQVPREEASLRNKTHRKQSFSSSGGSFMGLSVQTLVIVNDGS